jgi:hypothetical protein
LYYVYVDCNVQNLKDIFGSKKTHKNEVHDEGKGNTLCRKCFFLCSSDFDVTLFAFQEALKSKLTFFSLGSVLLRYLPLNLSSAVLAGEGKVKLLRMAGKHLSHAANELTDVFSSVVCNICLTMMYHQNLHRHIKKGSAGT